VADFTQTKLWYHPQHNGIDDAESADRDLCGAQQIRIVMYIDAGIPLAELRRRGQRALALYPMLRATYADQVQR